MKKELWKNITGYESLYLISNLGQVFSLYKNGNLTPRPLRTGYLRVHLFKDNIGTDFYIHRLVAKHFIKNPKNLPEINHKDGNKNNNVWRNLEWSNHKNNMQHGYRNGLINQTGSNHCPCF